MKRASWIVFTSGAIGAFCASMLTMPACAGAVGTAASVTAPATTQNVHKAELEQAQQKPANPPPSHTASPAPAQHRATAARTRATVQNDTPFSFRGISLGITLSALREANMIRATPHESTLVCETDVAGGDIGMMLKSYASPTIACRWAHRTSNGWAPGVDGIGEAGEDRATLRRGQTAPATLRRDRSLDGADRVGGACGAHVADQLGRRRVMDGDARRVRFEECPVNEIVI